MRGKYNSDSYGTSSTTLAENQRKELEKINLIKNNVVEAFQGLESVNLSSSEGNNQYIISQKEIINVLTSNRFNYSSNLINYLLLFIPYKNEKIKIHTVYAGNLLEQNIQAFQPSLIHIIPLHLSIEYNGHYVVLILDLINYQHYSFDPMGSEPIYLNKFLSFFTTKRIQYNNINFQGTDLINSGPYVVEWIFRIPKEISINSDHTNINPNIMSDLDIEKIRNQQKIIIKSELKNIKNQVILNKLPNLYETLYTPSSVENKSMVNLNPETNLINNSQVKPYVIDLVDGDEDVDINDKNNPYYAENWLKKSESNDQIKNNVAEAFQGLEYVNCSPDGNTQYIISQKEIINVLTNNRFNYSFNLINYLLRIPFANEKIKIHTVYTRNSLEQNIQTFNPSLIHIIPLRLSENENQYYDHYGVVILDLINYQHNFFDPGRSEPYYLKKFFSFFTRKNVQYLNINFQRMDLINSGPYIVEWIFRIYKTMSIALDRNNLLYKNMISDLDIEKIRNQQKIIILNELKNFKEYAILPNKVLDRYETPYTHSSVENKIMTDLNHQTNLIHNSKAPPHVIDLVDSDEDVEPHIQYPKKIDKPLSVTDSIPFDKQDINEKDEPFNLKKRKIADQTVSPTHPKKNKINKQIRIKKSNEIFNIVDYKFQPPNINLQDVKQYYLNNEKDTHDLCEKCNFEFILFHEKKDSIANQLFYISDVNALKGKGAFAHQKIPANTYLGCYSGEIIPINEQIDKQLDEQDTTYQFETTYKNKITGYIDAFKCGNGTRFFNSSQDPNIQVEERRIDGHTHLHFKSIKEIKPGEQMMISYGFRYFPFVNFPQLYLNTHDNWHTPAEMYQIHNEQYAIGQYSFENKIVEVFELPLKTFIFPKLLLAMFNDNLKEFKQLLEHYDPNLPILSVKKHKICEDDEQEHLTVLHLACYLAKQDYIQALLLNKKTCPNVFTRHTGDTPLFALVKGKANNDLVNNIAKSLLEKISCLTYDKNYYSILHFAIIRNNLALVKEVFNFEKKTQKTREDLFQNILPNTDTNKPLHASFDYCLKYKYFDILAVLLENIDTNLFLENLNHKKILNTINFNNLTKNETKELYRIFIESKHSKKLQQTSTFISNIQKKIKVAEPKTQFFKRKTVLNKDSRIELKYNN